MRFRLLTITLFLSCQVFCQYSDTIKLNEVRFLTSHNSYKKKPDPRVVKFLKKFKKQLSGEMDPIQLDYGHELLSVQLNEYGIRGFELDVNYDPKGGHFKKRRVNFFIKGLKQRSTDSLLRAPGFKILHIADVDYESNYTTFKQAITEIRDWSLTHPQHTPIFINIEMKRSNPGNYSKALRFLGFKKAVKMDSTALFALDWEIQEAFANTNHLYTPRHMKGEFGTVQERLEKNGWPALNEACGKVFFILDGDIDNTYVRSLDRGDNRPMFVYGEPSQPSTAFVIMNDPIGNEELIKRVADFYMVRTRSDAGTLEARSSDYSRWQSALSSGAQIISTDYYRPDKSISDFSIRFDRSLIDPATGLIFRR